MSRSVRLAGRVLELVALYEQFPNPLLRQLCLQLSEAVEQAGEPVVAPVESQGDARPHLRLVLGLAPDSSCSKGAAELGRRGGLKGGIARAQAMTEAERTASAKAAARARWDKVRKTRGVST